MTTRTPIEGQKPFQNLFEAAGVLLLIIELTPALLARATAPAARRPDYAARIPHRQQQSGKVQHELFVLRGETCLCHVGGDPPLSNGEAPTPIATSRRFHRHAAWVVCLLAPRASPCIIERVLI